MNREMLYKVIGMGVLALVLLVPVVMIRDLIAERQTRRNEAVGEIAAGWGRNQTLGGPVLVAQFRRTWQEVVHELDDGKPRERRTERTETGSVRLPVDAVDWNVQLATTEKARGIHKARLYTATVAASGRVTIPVDFGMTDRNSRYEWTGVRLVVGVGDARGVRSVQPLTFGDRRIAFAPGSSDAALARGVQAAIGGLDAARERTYDFGFALELAGSEAFAVQPMARATTVKLAANWAHPSFYGPYLPATQSIEADRFSALWRVSEFATQGGLAAAQCSDARKPCPQIAQEVFGVSLIEPVGVYQQLDRASKYGFLFIGLVFAAFFLFELLRQLAIHPIQYALVGLALALFFLLVTALSEHVAFGWAYLAGSIACVGLVTFYVIRVMRSPVIGSAFGAGLASLYGALYLMLNAEDYALLAGSILLFALLAGVMVGTRRVDWYRPTGSVADAR